MTVLQILCYNEPSEALSMITSGTLYETGHLELAGLSDLQATFANLPEDQYAEKRLRSRRYSRYKLSRDGKLTHLTHKEFMQSKNINKAVGDVERNFEEIETQLETNPAFIKMFEEFRAHTALSDESVIEAHQIRWHCKRFVKIPAPEGIHQDGFDFIAMYMVNSYNVEGGDIMIYPKLDAPPSFKKKLQPGDYVMLNDKLLYHYAAPLVPNANDDEGYWDLIVLTANEAHG
ncbi:MAG: 2OG-Fe dioxygenase family protein [Alphaproteobacteria bacterium]|nr:2OG-Fe dioxygenase family protein [Alphaproteobacteria bacterium]